MSDKKEKYTFNTKLYEVCADKEEKLRPAMQCVHFKNGFAFAGNGIIAIRQTLDFQSIAEKQALEGKLLHKDSFKAIMGFEMAEANDEGINCWNENGQTAFFKYYTPKDGEMVPDWDAYFKKPRGLTSLTFVGIDPEQFAKLCKALYAPAGNIRLQFTGVSTAIMVDVVGIEDQVGSIMPVILNDTLFS